MAEGEMVNKYQRTIVKVVRAADSSLRQHLIVATLNIDKGHVYYLNCCRLSKRQLLFANRETKVDSTVLLHTKEAVSTIKVFLIIYTFILFSFVSETHAQKVRKY